MSLAAIQRKIAELTVEMRRAAEAEDFEHAAALRNEIERLGGEGLVRKPPPGEMGLGTQVPVVAPPKGWKRPPRPDLHTNIKPRKR